MAKARGGWATIGTLALLLVVSFPSAAAQEASGGFRVAGSISLPSGAQAVFAPTATTAQALYAPDTAQADLTLDAPTLRVRLFEAHSLRVPGLLAYEATFTERSWTLTDAKVTILHDASADNTGILGSYPVQQVCDFTLQEAADVEPRQASQVPTGQQTTEDKPDAPDYWREIAGPHLYANAPGTVACQGAGALKIRGFDLRIEAAENTTEWRTGREEPTPAEVVLRWLYIESEAVTFTLSSPAPLEVVAGRASLAWDGEAWITPTTGELVSASVSYLATGERVRLVGDFFATLTPTGAGVADLSDLQGNLRATGLVRKERTPVPLLPASWEPARDLLPWTLFGVTVVAGGAALLLSRHRAHQNSAEKEYLEAQVLLANHDGDYDIALRWARIGRAAFPSDPDFAVMEATASSHLGDVDAALCAYREAARLSPQGGEPDYWSAVLLATRAQGNDHDRALEHLEAALRRDPSLAATVYRDSLFVPLHGADFDAMIHDAAQRRAQREDQN